MKRQVLFAFAICLATLCLAQTDTIFTSNGRIICRVKGITPDSVRFTFPRVDIVTALPKNDIQKIVFKNGKVQTFQGSLSIAGNKDIPTPNNIRITKNESSVTGLYKIGDISVSVVGGLLNTQEKMHAKAIAVLKIKAAMQGANVVYQTFQTIDSMIYTYPYYLINIYDAPAWATVSGVAYTTFLPSFNDFEALILKRHDFMAVQERTIGNFANYSGIKKIHKQFHIDNVTNENGMIMIEGRLEHEKKCSKFRVVSFTNNSFNIYYEYWGRVHNLKIVL